MEQTIKGRVVKIESKDYYVLSEDHKTIRCNLRGKFKKRFNLKKDKLFTLDVVAVGDFVDFNLNEDGSGTINEIAERKNYLSRKAPKIKGASYRGERLEQIISANIDNLFVVSSVDSPLFNNRVIDRILVASESSHIAGSIIINKIDLDTDNNIEYWVDLYKKIGYNVFTTCAKTGFGTEELEKYIKGKVNLFWGQSGVGKSSLLNYLYKLDLNIREISSFSGKGKHTTVTSVMMEVRKDTFIVDTPGIREIEPYGIKKEDLGHYFIEFADFIDDCKFNTCTHMHEPGCAVLDAVELGEISGYRYESYLKLLDSIEDDMIFT
ncbi:ribosome small subunit-dependent GTPase A [Bacteroidota bacterium]